MSKIYLAIPTMGWVSTFLAQWAQPMNPEYTIRVTPHSRARNTIVKKFLATDADVLMMVDSDTIPPDNAISSLHSLIEAGADVATGITPIYKDNKRSANVFREHADVEKFNDFADLPKVPFEVVGCGASCIMITRSMLERLQYPYFKTLEFDNDAICSEDLYFCDKVKEIGGTIVAHADVVCYHLKEVFL